MLPGFTVEWALANNTGRNLSVEKAWAAVRAERDRLLTATDWRLLRAAETGVPVEVEWLEYRQALRDITDQSDPFNIVWPVAPG